MSHIDTEVLIFLAFLACQVLFATMHKAHNIKWLMKITDNHYLVWLAHPAVVHSVHDYAIHFVIYSGRVIAAH
jgi:hypothetical protein